MRKLTAAVLTAALAFPLVAQQPIVETVEVRVANIDVVVTDRSGKPVVGLTKDDFTLEENGKPQAITNFYEVRPPATLPVTVGRADAAPAATAEASVPDDIRARRFVLFLDNYTLNPGQRNQILKALRKFIDTHIKPGDEVGLLMWQRGLQTITPLTGDRAAILKGLETIASGGRANQSVAEEELQSKRRCLEYLEVPKSGSPGMSFEQAWVHCKGQISSHADSVWSTGKALLGDLRATATTLAGIDGRKVLVLAGGHLPEQPGRELQMWAAQEFQQYLPSKLSNRVISEAAAVTARSQTFSLAETARFANANGVTFYVIDAADSRAMASTAESPLVTDSIEEFNRFTNTASAYLALAKITGGSLLTNSSNFDAAFETIARDLSAFYSIGYRPQGESTADRKLVVKTRNPDYVVRARQTFTPKTADEQMNDRVVANVFHSGASGEWPVRLAAGQPVKEGDQFKVPVQIQMDPKVTVIPQDGKLVGGFTLYLVVGNKAGNLSKVTKTSRKIEVPADGEAALRAQPMIFNLALKVVPGENIVSVGVSDQISGITGFARAEVTAK